MVITDTDSMRGLPGSREESALDGASFCPPQGEVPPAFLGGHRPPWVVGRDVKGD